MKIICVIEISKSLWIINTFREKLGNMFCLLEDKELLLWEINNMIFFKLVKNRREFCSQEGLFLFGNDLFCGSSNSGIIDAVDRKISSHCI